MLTQFGTYLVPIGFCQYKPQHLGQTQHPWDSASISLNIRYSISTHGILSGVTLRLGTDLVPMGFCQYSQKYSRRGKPWSPYWEFDKYVPPRDFDILLCNLSHDTMYRNSQIPTSGSKALISCTLYTLGHLSARVNYNTNSAISLVTLLQNCFKTNQ